MLHLLRVKRLKSLVNYLGILYQSIKLFLLLILTLPLVGVRLCSRGCCRRWEEWVLGFSLRSSRLVSIYPLVCLWYYSRIIQYVHHLIAYPFIIGRVISGIILISWFDKILNYRVPIKVGKPVYRAVLHWLVSLMMPINFWVLDIAVVYLVISRLL